MSRPTFKRLALTLTVAVLLLVIAATPRLTEPTRAAAAVQSSTPQLTQIFTGGSPSGGGFFSYPNGQFCGLFHLFMLDASNNPFQFAPVNLPDGSYTFRFVTSTFFSANDTVSLHLNLRPCCQPADLVVNQGQTATTTIGDQTFTVSGYTTSPAGFDKVGTCFIAPDGHQDFISQFTLEVKSCTPPPSGLVAWYPADGNANDIVGGKHGTLENGMTFAPGKVAQAFSGDGIDDFVSVPGNAAFPYGNSARTVDMWVFTRANSWQVDQNTIFEYGAPTPRNSFGIDMDNFPNIQFYAWDDDLIVNTGRSNREGWMHLAVTYDGTTLRVYVDGVLRGQRNYFAGINTSFDTITIGRSNNLFQSGNPASFDGLIDEVEIFNRALSQAEIQAIVNAGSAGKCKCFGPNIVSQPAPVTVCTGAAATFSVTATGPGLTYQWYKNGTLIPGATNSSFTIASVSASDAGSYDVAITNNCGQVMISTPATLTVNAPPAIVSQPSSQAVCSGATASFSVTATGAGLSYQWRKNGSNIAAATAATFTINSVTAANAGSYDVVVSGTCAPPAISAAASLTVNAPPAVVSSPTSQTVCTGSSASFSVTATGTGLMYQWRKNGVDIAGATGATFAINSVTTADAGSYDVLVSGACAPAALSAAATLTVNEAPVVTSNPVSQTVCPNTTVSFSAAASGTPTPGVQWQVSTDGVNFTDIAGETSATLSFVANNAHNGNKYRAVLTNSCSVATTSAATLSINQPPTVSAGGPYTVNEGGAVTVTASGSDPESSALTYEWDLDNNGSFEASGQAVSFSAVGLDGPSNKTIKVRVSDSCGLQAEASATVNIVNVAPTITTLNLNATSINEGDSVTLSASFTDPAGNLDAVYTAMINWGDGSPNTTVSITAGSFSFTAVHQYVDDKPTGTAADLNNITVTLTDKDGGSVNGATSVTVNNVVPVIASINAPIAPISLGTAATVAINISDVGAADTHNCTINWGDGNTTTGTVSEANGSGICTGTHTYAAASVNTVTVTVTDDDTGSATAIFQYIVVYDPEGGFVTGGGFIISPAGAFVADASLTGKANFGFVSKYQNGATVPTGNTEFQFKVANLNFKSTSYEFLVIAGAKAQYKGAGTINGQGNYKFMLTAIDGQEQGGGGVDKFRIRIWGDSGLVYDNQVSGDTSDTADPVTSLGGGNIVIHKQ